MLLLTDVDLCPNTQHSLWQVAGTSTYQVKVATARTRLLTGNANLQAHRARFKQNTVEATCPLCKQDNETVIHNLVLCPELKSHRDSFTSRLAKLYSGSSRLSSPSELCKFILNGPPYQVKHTHALFTKRTNTNMYGKNL